MIKNQKQAGITKGKLTQLRKAKEEFEKKANVNNQEEYELGLNSFNGLIKELEQQLQTYESLTEGNFHCLQPKSFEDIPKTLIAARLAQKMSHEDLGKLIGVKHQQIQRYEAGDYEATSWARILEIAAVLKLKFYFKRIIIINSENDEEPFNHPQEISQEKIEEATNAVRRNHSLIFN